MINWNMFEDVNNPAVSESELHAQRQSTRVYLVLMSLAVFILTIYTSLTYQNNSTTIKISSLDAFQGLQKLYGATAIECPCTTVSFIYATFIQVEPVFHQVCSSDFVSANWLNVLFDSYENQNLSETNAFTFSGTAFAYFQSLHIMCDLAKQAVIDARDLFLATSFVSSKIPDFDLFDGLINATLAHFGSTLSNNFIYTLQMFRGLVQSNGLISGYSTNWGLVLRNLTKDATIYTTAQMYGECNCATSASCIQPSTPFVPGFVVGCFPLESFLRSTLECLYDQSCVDTMSSYVNASYFPTALHNNNSRFASNLSTNTIVQQMFIESWSTNTSYDQFFQQCQPTLCSYTFVGRYNVVYVFTTLLGLYGGLTVLLKLVVPVIMRQSFKLVRKRQQANPQVTPTDDLY